MTINERFTVIINTLYSGNKSAFAKAIGVAPSVVDNIVGKRQGKPSYDVIEKVSALAAINLNWLISEIGEPLDFYNRKKEQPEEKKAASPELELRLLEMISDKDKTIREQAEELGRLRERIAQLEQRLEKTAGDVSTGDIASVG
ncbi:XRE family transcriptional regulator [Bacteroides acidifaciens]|jgi:transcriptional regulator with XRE-family HTH domain|uniref:XRE family transcriptional regulator n=1 Tax=Bacteroides acidifaciens TaxID=85831 RepID=UPI00242D47E8|nr:XRE family transcriptional regulator [Bacteroides acidifaciens]